MSLRYTHQDREILTSLAGYRALSVRHLALLCKRNTRALRRRLHGLMDAGFVTVGTESFVDRRGRPEQVLSLTQAGVQRLKADGVLSRDLSWQQASNHNLPCLRHHLLLNEFRIQLLQVPQLVPLLTVHSRCPSSPLSSRSADGRSLRQEKVVAAKSTKGYVEFVPDCVFALGDGEANKTVLFYLEVDLGTESLTSPQRTGGDVREKITDYQACFRTQQYKGYGQLWGADLRGFRLLFLASSTSRMAGLCQLARRTPPADFIWLTDQESMLSKGIWAPIWVRGGRCDGPLYSILGSRAPCPSPSPAEVA